MSKKTNLKELVIEETDELNNVFFAIYYYYFFRMLQWIKTIVLHRGIIIKKRNSMKIIIYNTIICLNKNVVIFY